MYKPQTKKEKAQIVMRAIRRQRKAKKLTSEQYEFFRSGVVKDL